jgi:predicted amidohydrolase YtcJ
MPNLILHHGRLWTQDDRWPDATAVALQAGRILAVGSDAEILALAGPHTERIDLDGRRVLPGLTDAHFHFQGWALSRRDLPLAGLASRQAVQAALGQRAGEVPPGQWIQGQGWNESDWPEPRLLTRHDLDAVAPRHPAVLWRSDLHLATANSLALRLAGIDGRTSDPEAGVIDREADGQPSGVLRDRAIDLVDAVLPQPGEQEIDAAMRAAIAEAHRLGLTGIHDFRIGDASESRGAFAAWQRLHAAGELRLRVWMMIGGELLEEAIRLGLRSGFGDDRLRIGAVKYFADGSLGARTAWMLQPYADGGLGLPVTSMAELASAIQRGAAAGLPVAIHAIGDRAVRELLDVFSEILPGVARSETGHSGVVARSETGHSGVVARSETGHSGVVARSETGHSGVVARSETGHSGVVARSETGHSGVVARSETGHSGVASFHVPHRIEHVQHSHPDDLRRLGSLGLVASVQPIHQVDDMTLVERALGRGGTPDADERTRWSYAWRTLLDHGAVLALGSDCPVASPNPFWGIHAAVTRQRRDGEPAGGWHPEQRLSVAEAIAGYTLGPAYASGQLAAQGSISPGKLADLVVLDRDLLTAPAQEIAAIRPVLTIFDGEIVFDGR